MVHSLGGDIVVFEVRQNSDITYRLFDWNHVGPKTGKPRPLQVEQAVEAIDFAHCTGYPQDLFGIQATQYQAFHMTDPQVFYNREDLWVPPQEKFNGRVGPMDPYYILMKLPGSDVLEYMLMSPFTPLTGKCCSMSCRKTS